MFVGNVAKTGPCVVPPAQTSLFLRKLFVARVQRERVKLQRYSLYLFMGPGLKLTWYKEKN